MCGRYGVKQEGDVALSSPVEEQALILLQVTALTKSYVDQVALADIALTIKAAKSSASSGRTAPARRPCWRR